MCKILLIFVLFGLAAVIRVAAEEEDEDNVLEEYYDEDYSYPGEF